jgi:hypothetical protein
MKTKGLMICFIIFLCSTGFPSVQIRIPGHFLLPTADGSSEHKGCLIFTPSEIIITCHDKIFQQFNMINTPKSKEIRLERKKVSDVFRSGTTIYIKPGDKLLNQYRHLYHERCKGFFYLEPVEEQVIIFEAEDKFHFSHDSNEIIKILR